MSFAMLGPTSSRDAVGKIRPDSGQQMLDADGNKHKAPAQGGHG